MAPHDISSGRGSLGALLLVVGALGTGILGNVLSWGVLRAPAFSAGPGQKSDPALVGTPLVIGGLAPFVLCLVLGVLLGRALPADREPTSRSDT
jgi:hypothetical protein